VPAHATAWVPGYDPGRVAPFGDLWLTGSQRLPRAFRRVGASFLGHQHLGIHRALIFADSQSTQRTASAPGEDHASPSPHLYAVAEFFCIILGCMVHTEPADRQLWRTLGASIMRGLVTCSEDLLRWSRGDSNPGPPPCKGGALPAKLRPRLPHPGGRAWTRTRDLGLIRAALSPPELRAQESSRRNLLKTRGDAEDEA
jgi:hypothetical protein